MREMEITVMITYVIQHLGRNGAWKDSAAPAETDEQQAFESLATLRAKVGHAIGPLRLIKRTEEIWQS